MVPALGLSVRLLRLTARALLLAVVVTTLGPVVHGVHADECDTPFVLHDESQHRVGAPATAADASPGEHCEACHFARSSRGPVSWEPTGLTALADGVLLYHADGFLIAAPSAAPRPARAPPLAL